MDGIERLKTGMPVVDVGSHFVGHVEQIHEHAFSIELSHDESIELNEAALFWVDEYLATLICVRERIRRYAA